MSPRIFLEKWTPNSVVTEHIPTEQNEKFTRFSSLEVLEFAAPRLSAKSINIVVDE